MLVIGSVIGGMFTLLSALLLTILAYTLITLLTLWLISKIETGVAWRYKPKIKDAELEGVHV
jgi:hypothetical protein